MALHFEPVEYAARQSAARKAMRDVGLDAMIFFAQESHYYLTGFDTTGYVWFQCGVLTADERPYTLLIRMPDRQNAAITSVCEDIRVWDDTGTADPALTLRALLEEKGLAGARVGVELFTHGLVAGNWRRVERALNGWCVLSDASDLVRILRRIKSAAEIRYVREAARIADDALMAMAESTHPGAFEGDIAAAGQSVILRNGGDVAPSGPTVGSGPRALSGRASTGPVHLGDSDQLTLEFAAPYRRYNACLMRTLVVGEPCRYQWSLYEAVRDALRAAVAATRTGGRLGDVYDAHQAVFDARGLGALRRPSCGYSLGATFRPTWMDVPPMIQSSNDVEIEAGMTLFLHAIAMDLYRGLAMSMGVTVLTSDGDCEVLSRLPEDLLVRH